MCFFTTTKKYYLNSFKTKKAAIKDKNRTDKIEKKKAILINQSQI